MKLLARVTPQRAAHGFAVANISFLGVDIGLAHMANDFARPVEWAPIVFSAFATLLLLPSAFGARPGVFRVIDGAVGFSAIAVGVIGMLLHLESGFFARQTLHDLVYSAPFVAPISYVGVGLLILLLQSKERDTPAFGSWLLILSLGGFVGNFALSLLDHAQNGFFHASEWVSVASAAFAISFLTVTLVTPGALPVRACLAMLGAEAVVGLAGFVLHVTSDLKRSAVAPLDRFVYGAPPFAPLLFADLALLAALGLWARHRDRGR